MILKHIWVFVDENGDLIPFRTFDQAHKYAFEDYDKDLKFEEKIRETYFYTNSWNSEDVLIRKLDVRKLLISEVKRNG